MRLGKLAASQTPICDSVRGLNSKGKTEVASLFRLGQV